MPSVVYAAAFTRECITSMDFPNSAQSLFDNSNDRVLYYRKIRAEYVIGALKELIQDSSANPDGIIVLNDDMKANTILAALSSKNFAASMGNIDSKIHGGEPTVRDAMWHTLWTRVLVGIASNNPSEDALGQLISDAAATAGVPKTLGVASDATANSPSVVAGAAASAGDHHGGLADGPNAAASSAVVSIMDLVSYCGPPSGELTIRMAAVRSMRDVTSTQQIPPYVIPKDAFNFMFVKLLCSNIQDYLYSIVFSSTRRALYEKLTVQPVRNSPPSGFGPGNIRHRLSRTGVSTYRVFRKLFA
jgi:hypothetical protein